MKNKAKRIELKIVSTYMGGALTVVVTLVVLGITLSALISDGGDRFGGVLEISVSTRGVDDEALQRFEPFGTLLSSRMRKPVNLTAFSGGSPRGDLYIISLNEYLVWRQPLELVPLYSVLDFEGNRDAAVIITSGTGGEPNYADMPPGAVAFVDSFSVNGFWIQLGLLEQRGFRLPERLDRFHFEGAAGHCLRVVFGVRCGAYALGACRMSDLVSLRREGILREGEVRIVARTDALPEIILAAPREAAADFYRPLEAVATALRSAESLPSQEVAVSCLKTAGIKRLVPIDDVQLALAQELADSLQSRF